MCTNQLTITQHIESISSNHATRSWAGTHAPLDEGAVDGLVMEVLKIELEKEKQRTGKCFHRRFLFPRHNLYICSNSHHCIFRFSFLHRHPLEITPFILSSYSSSSSSAAFRKLAESDGRGQGQVCDVIVRCCCCFTPTGWFQI